MFDLHAGVHLDEVELAVFVEELQRAGTAVAHFAAGSDAAIADGLALLQADARSRRFFDDFLMSALQRTIALAQVNDVAVMIREHLDFDVPGFLQEFLHVYLVVAERRERFGFRDVDGIDQRCIAVHDTHAAAAAAAGGFDDHRITDGAGDAEVFIRIGT